MKRHSLERIFTLLLLWTGSQFPLNLFSGNATSVKTNKENIEFPTDTTIHSTQVQASLSEKDIVRLISEARQHFVDHEYQQSRALLLPLSGGNILEKEPLLKAEALLILGETYRINGILDSALLFLPEALSISTAEKDEPLQARTESAMGLLSFDLSIYEQSLEHYRRALLLTKGRDVGAVEPGDIYTNMGLAYSMLPAKQDSAIYFLSIAVSYYEEKNDNVAIAVTLNKLGEIYFNSGLMSEAYTHYRKAEKLSRQNNSLNYLLISLNNIALYHKDIQQYDSAISAFNEMDSLSIAYHIPILQAKAHYNLGNLYLDLNDHDKANREYETTLMIGSEIGNPMAMGLANNSLAYLRYVAGDTSVADSLWDISLKIAADYQIDELNTIVRNLKADAYEMAGDYQRALKIKNQIHQLNDSLVKFNNAEVIHNLVKMYEVRNKDREIERKNKIIISRTWIMAILSLVMVVILVLSIVLFRKLQQIRYKNRILFQKVNERAGLTVRPRTANEGDNEFNKEEESERSLPAISTAQLEVIYKNFISYIEEQDGYKDPQISIQKIARSINTNEKYLRKAVRIFRNANITDVLNWRRVMAAAELMQKNPNAKNAEIFSECGFFSESTYYRVFKQVTGITPNEYKRLSEVQKKGIISFEE